jgi:HTH-type transcriptional regulator / antitoxin HigA
MCASWERGHADHRIDESCDPVEAIQFHLDRLGKTPKDLETILKCSRSRAWEILHRKRALSLPQIRALVRELGIPAERLIAEYSVSAA